MTASLAAISVLYFMIYGTLTLFTAALVLKLANLMLLKTLIGIMAIGY